MRLGSLALWIVISVALVIVGEAEPLGGLEEDEDEADDEEEEEGLLPVSVLSGQRLGIFAEPR